MRKILLLLLSTMLFGCSKYPNTNHRDYSRCIGISTPVYYGTWKYFMIKYPGQNWQPHPSNSTLQFNGSDTVYLSFYPNQCISNDLSCGYFELDINTGVIFSSYIVEDTMYLYNDVNGISWKLEKQ